MSREYRCRSCGELRTAMTTTGPLPTTCDVCDPEAAERRERTRRTERERVAARSRRLALANALLARFARLDVEPGRAAIAAAVKALASASGPAPTRRALVDLAAAALAWAEVLAPGYEEPVDAAIRQLAS